MNFQYIKKVEKSQDILDIAFNSAKKSAEEMWQKKKRENKIDRLKAAEAKRITSASRVISRRLEKIIDQFPIIDNLTDTYMKLIKNILDFEDYKQAIHNIKWATSKVESLSKELEKKLRKAETQREITEQRKVFYARSASILKKIQKHMSFLEESRKKLKRLPDLKEDYFTVAIAGFPNVGKSSLLKALTSAEPEIADYPFTTKGLNVGLLTNEKIQFVDVPGTLDRNKANIIEKNAHLIMQHAAEMVLFVIDPTGYCGYTIEEQMKLFQKTKERVNKEFYVVFSKTDMTEDGIMEQLLKKFPRGYAISAQNLDGIDALKEIVIEKRKKKTLSPSLS